MITLIKQIQLQGIAWVLKRLTTKFFRRTSELAILTRLVPRFNAVCSAVATRPPKTSILIPCPLPTVSLNFTIWTEAVAGIDQPVWLKGGRGSLPLVQQQAGVMPKRSFLPVRVGEECYRLFVEDILRAHQRKGRWGPPLPLYREDSYEETEYQMKDDEAENTQVGCGGLPQE